MLVSTLVLVILPLLHNAQAQQGKFSGQAAEITAPPELSTPHMAASLDIARNVSAEFPSDVEVPIHPSTYVNPYYTNPPPTDDSNTQSTNYIPPCWTHPTSTTAKPRYTTTPYIPPCWTHPTTTTTKQPPTTQSTTPSVPPCWTATTTTAKPQYKTTPSIPPCWTATTTTTTEKPSTTTPYVPPCWTAKTATPSTTTPYVPPCWTATTTTTTEKPSTTTPTIPPCWTQTTPAETTPQSTTENIPTSTTAAPQGYVCAERNHYYPIPTECNTYIKCNNNVASKQMCPKDQVFKPDTVWPANPCVSSSEYKCTHGYVLDEVPKNICPDKE